MKLFMHQTEKIERAIGLRARAWISAPFPGATKMGKWPKTNFW